MRDHVPFEPQQAEDKSQEDAGDRGESEVRRYNAVMQVKREGTKETGGHYITTLTYQSPNLLIRQVGPYKRLPFLRFQMAEVRIPFFLKRGQDVRLGCTVSAKFGSRGVEGGKEGGSEGGVELTAGPRIITNPKPPSPSVAALTSHTRPQASANVEGDLGGAVSKWPCKAGGLEGALLSF